MSCYDAVAAFAAAAAAVAYVAVATCNFCCRCRYVASAKCCTQWERVGERWQPGKTTPNAARGKLCVFVCCQEKCALKLQLRKVSRGRWHGERGYEVCAVA